MTILRIIEGNIKDEGGNSDVVVNASNEAMAIGSGVAAAIGQACGQADLQKDCDEFMRELKEVHRMAKVPTGSMGITGAHAMTRAKAIFHAVAPICASRSSRTLEQAKQLRMAYTLVFEAAAAYDYKVVSVPFLGAGIFNYPPSESVELAVICALNAASSVTSIEEIRFVSIDKNLVQHMQNILGGHSVTVVTRNDAQPIFARIPLSSKVVSGDPANNADIVKCFQFTLDSQRAIARANRVQMALQAPPPNRGRAVIEAAAAIVRGEVRPRKIKLESAKKAMTSDVDYFIVFGECVDLNDIKIDLGPFGDWKDRIVQALHESSQYDSNWASVVISLKIPTNTRPKELICIFRQNENATLPELMRTVSRNLSFHRRQPPFTKVGVIIPTTCVLNEKWRLVVPVFVILCEWKQSMTQVNGATLLWNTDSERTGLRTLLDKKTEFDVAAVNIVLQEIDTNYDLICVPTGIGNGYKFRLRPDGNYLKPVTATRSEPRTPRMISTPTPIRDCDSPGITQFFSNLRTFESVGGESIEAPMDVGEQESLRTRVTIGVLKDIADEEGDVLCIPIDNTLSFSSNDLSKRLSEYCGDEMEQRLDQMKKVIGERGLERRQLDGVVQPIHSYNFHQFKEILTMVSINVKTTSMTCDEEKSKLYASYEKMIDMAEELHCKRLVITLSSVHSHGFRIEEATLIAAAAVFAKCPSKISNVHFAVSDQSKDFLRPIFGETTCVTISTAAEGEELSAKIFPHHHLTKYSFDMESRRLMTDMMREHQEDDDVFSQSTHRMDTDAEEFQLITINVEEESSGIMVPGDGRIVYVGTDNALQSDIREQCGEMYSDYLKVWNSELTENREWKSRNLKVGSTMLTTTFNCSTYAKGLSHVVLRKCKPNRPSRTNVHQACQHIENAIELLDNAGANEVVISIPSKFFSNRYSTSIVMISIISYVKKNCNSTSIRRYRIVGEERSSLNELKRWLKNAKELKSRADIQNLVNRIEKKRRDATIEQSQDGGLNLDICPPSRIRTKQSRSDAQIREYNSSHRSQQRSRISVDERRQYNKEEYARKKARASNKVTWEFSEKYSSLKITPTMRSEFSNALKLLLIMRRTPECAEVARRYKYISKRTIDELTSTSTRTTRKQHRRKMSRIWTSLQKRPELAHLMFSLSIIFKVIRSGTSKQSSIPDTIVHFQYLMDAAREIRNTGKMIAEREARKIMEQMNRKVYEKEGASEDENLVRRVGRLRFHICPPCYEGEKETLIDGFDRLIREWRGAPEPSNDVTERVTVVPVDPSGPTEEGVPEQVDVVVDEEDAQPLNAPCAWPGLRDIYPGDLEVIRQGSRSLQPSQSECVQVTQREVESQNHYYFAEFGLREQEQELEEAVRENVYEEDYEQEMRVRDETQINNRLATVARNVLEAAQEEVEEILSAEPDMADHGPALPEIILPFTTYMHMCDEEQGCEELTADHCRFILKKVNEHLDLLKKEEFAMSIHEFEEKQEGEERSALELLKKMGPCYQGVRSILNRYYKLRSAIKAMRRGHRALKGDRIDHLRMQLNDRMPKEIRNIVNNTLAVLYRMDDSNFKEGHIRMQYSDMIKNFTAALENAMETSICKICHTYTSPSRSVASTSYRVADYISDRSIGDVFCNRCLDAMRLRKPSKLRIPENKYNTTEVPGELADLNWVEKLLIQRTRPVINTVHLRDKGGRKTPMKATKGAMVLLPVPTEGTLSHVSNTLPSADNLNIIVSCNTTQTIVNMEKVVVALKYLKKNHPQFLDINIDENFVFPRDSIQGNDGGTIQLIAKNSSDPTLIEHEDIEPHTVQDVGGEGKRMHGDSYEQYKLKRNPYDPISLDINHPDTRAFPWLFPDGKFGLHDHRIEASTKARDHTEKNVTKWQMKCIDRRFATDPSYLSFVHGFLEGKLLLSSVALRAKMARGKMDTATFIKLLEEGSPDFQINMSTIAAKLRGRDAFWQDGKRTLKSHISIFGPPTWFVTLNPAMGEWTDMLRVYRNAYPKDNITSDNLMDWIVKDPFFFARQFQSRLSTVMREVLLKEDGPLGTITHFFHRIEYQQRGTQHVHMLLWAKDAPAKDATEAEKLAYITKHVTARLPSKKNEPELYRIITKHQMHFKRHSKTCLRVLRYGKRVVKKCRFDYPRPALATAKFNRAAKTLTSIPTTFKKPYYLARKKGPEQYINDYNPLLTLVWGANIDVQYVTDLPHIIPYLTSYTSKGESGKVGNAIQESLREAYDGKAAYRSLMDMLRMREIGTLEMVDLIMGHELHKFDSDHVFINTNLLDKRQRVLRSADTLSSAVMAFKDNMYDNYYPDRPKEMEDLSLFQCLTHFTVNRQGDDGNRRAEQPNFNDQAYHRSANPYRFHYHVNNHLSQFYNFESDNRFPTNQRLPIPKSNNMSYRRLAKPKVARFYFPHLDSANDECREDYYRRLCMSFIPWRDEAELLSAIPQHTFNNYKEMWSHYTEKLKTGTSAEQEALSDIEQLIRHHTFLLDQQAAVMRNMEEMRKRMEAIGVEEDPEQGDEELYGREVDAQRMEENIGSMNAGQKAVYDEILKGIEAQEEYKRQVKEIEQDSTLNAEQKTEKIGALTATDAMRFIVSGTAGTGKSFLINNLADHLTVKYCEQGKESFAPAVCIAAPTGIAAVQIKGSTIHSLLMIEVQKTANAALSDMPLAMLNKKRALLRNIRLFIIDEMSMVSNVLLAKMNLRMQEIFANNDLFGGCNILLLGDLMQLPPVRASKIFENLMDYEVTKIFGGGVLPTANFFNTFIYRELTENMRQASDPTFGNIMLNSRVQALTSEDVEKLKERIIPTESGDTLVSMEEAAQFYQAKRQEDSSILGLFATNKEVNTFNELIMAALGMEIITIEATDSLSAKSRGQDDAVKQRESRTFARPYQRMENDLADSAEAAERRLLYGRRRKRGKGTEAFGAHEEDSNITAGLPKVLRVALEGRVMLRRNIRPSIGLVNGATGTLKNIEKEGDDIVSLIIQFDGIEKLQTIEKKTAIFDVGLDDQISRTQFPIVSAFAATVHKCQGLTLRNVLISTRNFFAPGMAFVAFSRVTSINGLHLMDFCESKVWCDLASLRKYNQLRETVDLSPFPIPNRKKPSASVRARTNAPMSVVDGDVADIAPLNTTMSNAIPSTPTTSRPRRRALAESDPIDEEPAKKRQPSTSDPTKRRRQSLRQAAAANEDVPMVNGSDVTSLNSSPEKKKKKGMLPQIKAIFARSTTKLHPLLMVRAKEDDDSCVLSEDNHKMGYRFSNVPVNNGGKINCFANAAVNSLLCIESLMQQLMRAQDHDQDAVVKLLLRAYQEDRSDGHIPIHTSAAIRQLLYPANRQDDAEDMIAKIIENSFNIRANQRNIMDQFKVSVSLKVPCKGRCRSVNWTTEVFNGHMLHIGHSDGRPGTIEDQIKKLAVKLSFGGAHDCEGHAHDDTKPVEVLPDTVVK